MRKTWKQILLGALTLCVLASGCGGGKGGGGTPEDPNADLPMRKKISTPVASSFKVDGRTVNIYEYTGLTFKDQILWTDTLAVDGDLFKVTLTLPAAGEDEIDSVLLRAGIPVCQFQG